MREQEGGGWGLPGGQTPQKPTKQATNQMLHYISVVVAPAPGFQTGVGVGVGAGGGAQVGIVIAAVAKLVAHVGY